MHPSEIAIFKKRKEEKSKIYSYEKEVVKLSPEFEKKFKATKKAWAFFQSLPPSYQKPAIHWVVTAQREITRIKRFNELVTDSQAGRKIKRLSY
jgi:uncharacterized protein YdeI (YjbR/CyaY-like superfamily)